MRTLALIGLLAVSMTLQNCLKKAPTQTNEIPFDPDRTIEWVIQNSPEDLVVASAAIDDGDPEPYPRKLVLIDYYKPESYKIIEYEHTASYPIFSHDKKKILFRDEDYRVSDTGSKFMLYDVVQDTIMPVVCKNFYFGDDLYGVGTVWNTDDTGFYFKWQGDHYGQRILYYDFATQLFSQVYFQFLSPFISTNNPFDFS